MKKTKKAAMGPWPSIIGGVIMCAIIIYILVFIASGGLKQSREIINRQAYNEFKTLYSEGWTDGTSIATDWKMTGLKGETWGVVFLDTNSSRKFYQLELCSRGQTTGLCVTSRTKAILSDCLASSKDLCVCLVNFGTGNKNIYNAIAVPQGGSLDETFIAISNWNKNKLFPLLEYPVDFVECNLLMSNLLCATYFQTPCLLKPNDNHVLVWFGTNKKDIINYELLKVTKPPGYDATFMNITGTIVGGGDGGNDIFGNPLQVDKTPWY